MNSKIPIGLVPGSLHLNYDLAPLVHMIKVMSLKLSSKARERLAWMDSFRECGNAAQVCRHFSIPLRTFWRWRKRYDPFDLRSLENKKTRPLRMPRKTSIVVERAVLHIKQAHPRWGKEKISFFLNTHQRITLSGKTCWKILKRHRLIVRYCTRKRKPPKPRVRWAQVRLPGDLLQMDTKFVSFHGTRIFQYTIIDVISRMRYANLYRTLDMATTVSFLEEALPVLTLSHIAMIQTDNGKEFQRSVSAWCRSRKIRHVFSHKRRPQENAYVERSHRTDEEEFYSLTAPEPTFEGFKQQFRSYLDMTNTERPHWGLKGKTPQQALFTYQQKACHMS